MTLRLQFQLQLLIMLLGLLCTFCVGAQQDSSSTQYQPVTSLSQSPRLISPGETVELNCSINTTLPSYSRLQWLDGDLPIESSARKKLIYNACSVLTLRIHNFSIEDYGVYKCRCVNLYNFQQYNANSISGIPSYCSLPSEEIRLIPEVNGTVTIIETHGVGTPGEVVHLDCNETNDTVWVRVNSNLTASEVWDADDVIVATVEDQGKFICYEGNDTVHKIVYISIKDYLPMRILDPVSDVTTVSARKLLNTSIPGLPLCTVFSPYPQSTDFYLRTEDIEIYYSPVFELHVIDSFVYVDLQWFPNSNFVATPVLLIFCVRIDDLCELSKVLNNAELLEQFAGAMTRDYTCTFSNQWENQTVTFHLNVTTSDEGSTRYQPVTSLSQSPRLISPGETVELNCSIDNTLPSYSRLQWLDGDLPIESSARKKLIYNACSDVLTLRIHNFSIEDYGVYKCRCVNLYNFQQYNANSISGIPSYCSLPSEEIRLIPEVNGTVTIVETHIVGTPGEVVHLACNETNDTVWVRVNSNLTASEVWDADNVTVATVEDQGKFVCHEGNDTVHKIVYISIKDYLPMRILDPVSDVTTVSAREWISLGSIPLCTVFSPYPNMTQVNLYLGNLIQPDMPWCINNSVCVNQMWPWTPDSTDSKLVATLELILFCILQFLRGDGSCDSQNALNNTELLEEFAQLMTRDYTCMFSNQWENQTVTFHLNVTTSDEVFPIQLSTSSIIPTPTRAAPLPSPLEPLSSSQSSMAVQIETTQPGPSTLSPTHVSLLSPSTVSATPTLPASSKNQPTTVIVAVISTFVGAIGLLSLGLFVLYTLCRRKQSKVLQMNPLLLPLWKGKYRRNQFERLSLTLSENDPIALPAPFSSGRFPVSRQMAVCIHELQQSQWLFPFENLQFHEDLGSGAFGTVKKATALSVHSNKPPTTVAVKMLKDIAADDDEKDIISELKVLQHVGAHPNVVSLLGASFNNGKLYIIVEYCQKGSLLSYLRSKRKDPQNPLSTKVLIEMAYQVACGMEFLGSKNCIHRDLAARNILINECFELKVADFGLARKLYASVYRPSRGKLPLKWMAPESVSDGDCTIQSDVWSFGVLLWEIMTLGRSPYPGWSPSMVIKEIQGGYRMPKPANCPQEVYEIMMKCWQSNPSARPTFTELSSALKQLFKRETLYNHYYNVMDDFDVHSHDSGSSQECHSDSLCTYCKKNEGSNSDSVSTGYISKRMVQKSNISRLDSNDSGIKVSDYQSSTTDSSFHAAPYLQLIRESRVSVDDGDQQSAPSLCAYCKAVVECEHTNTVYMGEGTLCLCSTCRTPPGGSNCVGSFVPQSSVVDLTEHSPHNVGCSYCTKPTPQALDLKHYPVEAQNSNDSGIPVTPGSGCVYGKGSLYMADAVEQELCVGPTAKGAVTVSTDLKARGTLRHCYRLSAHPDNRHLFEKLGIEESDV